jgi:outer membrane protein assembly factor BamD
MHDAYDSFTQLVEQYPASKYATDARLRINYIINSLASSEVHVARYYFRRGAYVAAVNRAQYAIEQYPRSPMTEQALYIMVRSYDALNLPRLRDDAKRVLLANYPHTALLNDGFRAADKAWWQLW